MKPRQTRTVRELAETYRGRPLMIEVSPRGMVTLWPKGTRQRAIGVRLCGAYEKALAETHDVAPLPARKRRK